MSDDMHNTDDTEIENPNAFPTPMASTPSDDVVYSNCKGMTLRDYFAGQALAGLVSLDLAYQAIEAEGLRSQTAVSTCFAKQAYDLADAMLKARQQVPKVTTL